MALEYRFEGVVYVGFMVDKDGSLQEARIMKGVHRTLDKESVRLINLMPKWIPGINNNRTVRTEFILPIKFELGA